MKTIDPRVEQFLRILDNLHSGLQVTSERFKMLADVRAVARGCKLHEITVEQETDNLGRVRVSGDVEHGTVKCV